MTNPTILFVGAGAIAEPYLDAAQRRGARIAVNDTARHLTGLAERYPVVMETLVRMPGGHLMEGISRTQDKDLYAAHVQAALGSSNPAWEAFPHDREEAKKSGGRYGASFLVADRRGTLESIQWGHLRASGGIMSWGERFEPGQEVQPAELSADRVACAIVHAGDDVKPSQPLDELLDPARVVADGEQHDGGRS